MIEFPSNGSTAQGYITKPGSGSGPGVLVIQEWWGLNDQIKNVAERLAREGFTVLAPDFYHGDSARIGEPDQAAKLMMALNIDEVARDARGAAECLRQQARGSKVGVIGFCMGGQLALLAGTVAPESIAAIVDFYGIHPDVHPDYARMQARVLGLFAELDEAVDDDARASLARQLDQAGVKYEFHTYPGVDHAFMNEQQLAYNESAAEDAWSRAIAFLRANLSALE